MATPALTDEELLAQLEGIGGAAPSAAKPNPAAASTSNKQTKTAADQSSTNADAAAAAADPLALLENLALQKPQSRPNTPSLRSAASRRTNTTTTTGGDGVHTPASSARNSEDRSRASVSAAARRSGESATPLQHELTPTSEDEAREAVIGQQQQQQQPVNQSSWWGGIFATASATASAAVKQAEAAVKEIQKNEEAQKWAEQVRGNVGALRGFGDEIRSRALPTFTDLLHTIAPPISQHERLQIHITHDLIGYPSLDPTIYTIFSRVMSQVEGGDLLVIQRGLESKSAGGSSRAGWSDGPWWRDSQTKRDLGIVDGLAIGTKLVRTSAEAYANEYFASRGGLEEAVKQASEIASAENPVRSSDIFLAIQAVGVDEDESLFAAETHDQPSGDMVESKTSESFVCFAVYLHDPIHAITFHTTTQVFPRRWITWLDAEQDPESEYGLPTEIADIVLNGGIDPREWVSEWVEETIGLGVGVIAQRYVAKRMGVGEGGIGRGKAAKPAVDSGAGELARAV